MVIDTHVHLIKPHDSRGRPQVYSPNPASAEDYVALMDRAGVDRAFFISWSPEDIPSDVRGKVGDYERVRETMNPQYALDVMRRYPDRFYWFPCHLGPEVPDHMQMARRHLQSGAAGLKVLPSFWGELPDDDRVMAICDLAREFGAEVIIDTSFWYLGKEDAADPATLPEGHRQVAQRVRGIDDYFERLATLFTAFPAVNFSLAHAGARSYNAERFAQTGRFIRQFPNVYADLGALSCDPPFIEPLVETAGADRVMFGTDWPHFAQGPQMARMIGAIRLPGRFRPEVARMILGFNALSFVRGRAPGLVEVQH